MGKFQDLADYAEDARIKQIGRSLMHPDVKTVAFVVDSDNIMPGKADRYIRKLVLWFPKVRQIKRIDGPVPDTTTVIVGKK